MDLLLEKCFLLSFIFSLQIHGNNGCSQEERLAILDFKAFVQSNGDDADKLLPSWKHDRTSDCCRWDRVTCDSTHSHVIKLSLDNIRQIPWDGYYEDMSIWDLNISLFQPFMELRSLNLSYNAIFDFIDHKGSKSLSKLNKLENLDLSWNVLYKKEVLKVLGEFAALKYLDLHNNFIEGSLSYNDLAGLSNLKTIILNFNQLNGTLPIHHLVNFSSLEILDLSWNYFTGSIPQNIGHLSSLKALNASRNQLTGYIPRTLSKLSQIQSLDLSYNRLSGKIPPELTDLHLLKLFSVAHNNLSGRIPDIKPQFGAFDNSSYEGNPLLCGLPLVKSC